MQGTNLWSYCPYQPLLAEEEIYISRLVPSSDAIHLEWLNNGQGPYTVLFRERGRGDFLPCGETAGTEWDITGLTPGGEYEFFVRSASGKSHIRLARCGETVGTVVNYLHPEDHAYAFSGQYLCSPSLLRHPDGYLLSSMDVFGHETPQNLTMIFRSDDEGATWHYVSSLMPCFWGKLFLFKGAVYMLAASTEYGDLLIGKSEDGGKTFSAPVTLLRGSNGKNFFEGVHKNPQNVLIYNGRIYNTLEWGNWKNKDYCHAAMVMSASVDGDLLDPLNWHFTAPRKFDRFSPELQDMPLCTMTIEGTLTVDREGRLLNIMRFGGDKKALVYLVNTADPDAPLTFLRCMDFPGNLTKFMIKYDPVSDRYFSIASIVHGEVKRVRNLLSLISSADLYTWKTEKVLVDYTDKDPQYYGFQYVDFEIEGEDILYLCRVSDNGAFDFHDSNYQIFDRIRGFRHLNG